MVRPRRMTADAFFAPLGDIAFFALSVPVLAAMLIAGGCLLAVDWLHERRFLGPATFGALVAVVVLHLAGCASAPSQAPHDPRDPAIWRPTTPANYPLPR